MPQNYICTTFELKKFAFSIFRDGPTTFDFARFIESKSEFKYTIVEIEFLIDTFKLFEELAQSFFEVNKDFSEKWGHLEIPKIRTVIKQNT